MLKVELCLGDGFWRHDMSLKVLLNGLCSTNFEVIGVKSVHVTHLDCLCPQFLVKRSCSADG